MTQTTPNMTQTTPNMTQTTPNTTQTTHHLGHIKEEVTQDQYNLHVSYEQSKYRCSRKEAILVINKRYFISKACEDKWNLYKEQLKLAQIRSLL